MEIQPEADTEVINTAEVAERLIRVEEEESSKWYQDPKERKERIIALEKIVNEGKEVEIETPSGARKRQKEEAVRARELVEKNIQSGRPKVQWSLPEDIPVDFTKKVG